MMWFVLGSLFGWVVGFITCAALAHGAAEDERRTRAWRQPWEYQDDEA